MEDDLQKALRMSMQHVPPEPKRSKPRENNAEAPMGESPEVRNRRTQRELMAEAAEKRMMAASAAKAVVTTGVAKNAASSSEALAAEVGKGKGKVEAMVKNEEFQGKELSSGEAEQLFSMVFGNGVSKEILAQWSNQGIRFSPDDETSVQHEGGPCGVLAAI